MLDLFHFVEDADISNQGRMMNFNSCQPKLGQEFMNGSGFNSPNPQKQNISNNKFIKEYLESPLQEVEMDQKY